jgi:phage FluMu protein gp41
MSEYTTVTAQLPHGLVINGSAQRDFTLREYTTGDLFDAEAEVNPAAPLIFSAALLTRQLVSIGNFKGPFTLNMLRSLHPADFACLRSKQREIEQAGEDSGSAEKGS